MDLITTPFIRNEMQQNIIYILDITKADYDCFEDLKEDNGIFEVDPSTVCQYTGLTDKNGRKIFEGDIIETQDGERYVIEWQEDTAQYVLCHTVGLQCSFGNYWGHEVEAIGNIFDNHELIEGVAECTET